MIQMPGYQCTNVLLIQLSLKIQLLCFTNVLYYNVLQMTYITVSNSATGTTVTGVTTVTTITKMAIVTSHTRVTSVNVFGSK